MSRSALIRFAAALAVIGFAAWLWFGRATGIDRREAEARAARMLAAYVEQTGEPPVHFAGRRTMAYPDGWEFSWTYRPCADTAELRIFVRRSGASHYALLPDCAPVQGFAVRPRRV